MKGRAKSEKRLAARSEASIGALLDVARRSFGEYGYADASLESIAAAAGMTKGAVYHHFGSKDALFEEVFRREHRRLIALVIARSRNAPDPLAALLQGIRAYLKEILDPATCRIFLQDGPSVLGWERWRRCEEPGFQDLMERSLAAAAERGLLRRGLRPAPSATLLLGAVTEAALTIANSPTPSTTARRIADELAAHVGALGAS